MMYLEIMRIYITLENGFEYIVAKLFLYNNDDLYNLINAILMDIKWMFISETHCSNVCCLFTDKLMVQTIVHFAFLATISDK